MSYAIYDRIGKTYDATRHADPTILQKIIDLLQPQPGEYFLDVGCGTGNYAVALNQKGLKFAGVDLSHEMLNKARQKSNAVRWYQGDASALPFESGIFDGAICTLATHHFHDLQGALNEVFRVLHGGRFVIFTSTPHQMAHYWLNHYFPNLIKESSRGMLEWFEFEMKLKQAGFVEIETYPFFIDEHLQDCFLHSGKYRPHLYLDPKIRADISTFAKHPDHPDLPGGLKSLAEDIESGHIASVIADYENNEGDYLFLVAKK